MSHSRPTAAKKEPSPKAGVDESEVERFDALAQDWWNPQGPMAPLHRQGPARLAFLRRQLAPADKAATLRPLEGMEILDLGCGGGLVAEPLARMGATVTGIDAAPEVLAVARVHAAETGLTIDYQEVQAEGLLRSGRRFDAVVSLEVIEHVPDPQAFVATASGLLRPQGTLVLSTLNRTPKSFAMAIVGAEYLLRWLPRGTHSWRRFLKPSEVGRLLRDEGLEIADLAGIVYNPLDRGWRLSDRDLDVNYILAARKIA